MFEFNPLSPEFKANPYAYYDALRAAAPVYFWEPWQIWFLSTYDDCAAALKDTRLGRDWDRAFTPEQMDSFPKPPDDQRPLVEKQRNWMLRDKTGQPFPYGLIPTINGLTIRFSCSM